MAARASQPVDSGRVIGALGSIALRNAPLIAGTVVISALYLALGPPELASWVVPILVFVGLWLVSFGARQRADLMALRRGGPPSDGAYVAVCGRTVALDDVLPENGKLAWRFQIFTRVRNRKATGTGARRSLLSLRFDSFHLIPSGVETDAGVVRLAGFPDLIDRDKESVANDVVVAAKAAAISYPRWIFPAVAREWAIYPGSDRLDLTIAYRQATEEGSRGELKSWIMHAGEDVCVCGRWYDGALHPDRWRPRGLPVYLGTPEQVERALADEVKVFFYGGGGALAAALVIAIWSLL